MIEGPCDNCNLNPAVKRVNSHYMGESYMCRTCGQGCFKHWSSFSDCGCPVEIRCVDCDDVIATIQAGEPEPPLHCEECQALIVGSSENQK